MVVFLLNFIQNDVGFFPECTINYVKRILALYILRYILVTLQPEN
jgi:hypothetical protein